MSGYPGDKWQEIVHRDRTVGFIAKPFEPDELARVVREMLDRRQDPEDQVATAAV
jgi:DNA-binding response OmpR family regulator